MKYILTTICLLIGSMSFGQQCDTIKGMVINCVDILDQKQGFWAEGLYEWRQQQNYQSVDGFCQSAPLIMVQIGISSEGNYVDNKKVGVWKYYSDKVLEREVSFNDNGTIEEKNFMSNSVINISSDSTLVSGFTIQNGDTISIGLSNQKGVFKLNLNTVIVSFDCLYFNKFEYELLRLKMGIYDRDIKMYKLE